MLQLVQGIIQRTPHNTGYPMSDSTLIVIRWLLSIDMQIMPSGESRVYRLWQSTSSAKFCICLFQHPEWTVVMTPILHHTQTSSPVKSADRNVKDKIVTFLGGMHNLGIEKSPLEETAKAPALGRQEDGCILLHSSSQLVFIKRCH